MGYDVFISYKAEEYTEASWTRKVLEENGLSCWMAPESIPGGSSYADEIEDAIKSSSVFVLILSEKAQQSQWIKKELDRALGQGLMVLPFMIENCQLHKAFNFYLTDVQRYNAYASKADAMNLMIKRIKGYISEGCSEDEQRASLDSGQSDAVKTEQVDFEHISLEKLIEYANGGNIEAQRKLGGLYYYGRGVPKDHKLAYEMFLKAANSGDVDSQFILGSGFFGGTKIGQSQLTSKERRKWLKKAASNGCTEAKKMLHSNIYYRNFYLALGKKIAVFKDGYNVATTISPVLPVVGYFMALLCVVLGFTPFGNTITLAIGVLAFVLGFIGSFHYSLYTILSLAIAPLLSIIGFMIGVVNLFI